MALHVMLFLWISLPLGSGCPCKKLHSELDNLASAAPACVWQCPHVGRRPACWQRGLGTRVGTHWTLHCHVVFPTLATDPVLHACPQPLSNTRHPFHIRSGGPPQWGCWHPAGHGEAHSCLSGALSHALRLYHAPRQAWLAQGEEDEPTTRPRLLASGLHTTSSTGVRPWSMGPTRGTPSETPPLLGERESSEDIDAGPDAAP